MTLDHLAAAQLAREKVRVVFGTNPTTFGKPILEFVEPKGCVGFSKNVNYVFNQALVPGST